MQCSNNDNGNLATEQVFSLLSLSIVALKCSAGYQCSDMVAAPPCIHACMLHSPSIHARMMLNVGVPLYRCTRL